MEKSIDARGMQCPLPVIETKKILKELKEGTIEVYVDNEIAVQNLIKMATQMHLKNSMEKITEDHYIVRIQVSDHSAYAIKNKKNDSKAVIKESAAEDICDPDSVKGHTLVVISADHMGEGDVQLGKTLMKGFVYALTELERLPETIILYNGGAKLSVEGSDSLEDLKMLESQGVEILTCGTCLNFYEIGEKLSVGSVTNMYTIAELMMKAAKIIKP